MPLLWSSGTHTSVRPVGGDIWVGRDCMVYAYSYHSLGMYGFVCNLTRFLFYWWDHDDCTKSGLERKEINHVLYNFLES